MDFSERLLRAAERKYRQALSERVVAAYRAVPRHRFVSRYKLARGDAWRIVSPENLAEHLPNLYADHPLLILERDGEVVATISQPTFVLRQLDWLRIEPGHRVFEIGAGSGWNAALMGHLVGPSGKVVSLEIEPELAREAAVRVREFGLSQVEIRVGDGGEGWPAEAPYDRIIFTAGAPEVPEALAEQLAIGGLMLFVRKREGEGDRLLLLRKTAFGLQELFSIPCGFVPMRGKHGAPSSS